MVLSNGFVVVMVSIRHYLTTYNDELQQMARWSCLQTQAEVGGVFAAELRLGVVVQ
jgi:hypothetical protein